MSARATDAEVSTKLDRLEGAKAPEETLEPPDSLRSRSGLQASTDDVFAPGTRLAERYRILRVLGQGGEVGGRHFISMKYVDGQDLASLLRQVGRLPRERGSQIACQICHGLAAAHDKGVLHRDLKPANLLIDRGGNAFVTDFGLARLAETLRDSEAMAGTPAYMAPEQFQGRKVSQRTDVYSLGLVLYESWNEHGSQTVALRHPPLHGPGVARGPRGDARNRRLRSGGVALPAGGGRLLPCPGLRMEPGRGR